MIHLIFFLQQQQQNPQGGEPAPAPSSGNADPLGPLPAGWGTYLNLTFLMLIQTLPGPPRGGWEGQFTPGSMGPHNWRILTF